MEMDSTVGDDYVVCLPLTVDLRLFCLERLSQTVCCNVVRRHHVRNAVVSVFGHLLSWSMEHGVDDEEELRRHSEYLLERVTVSVFSVCSSLAAQCSVGVRCVECDDLPRRSAVERRCLVEHRAFNIEAVREAAERGRLV